MSTELDEAVHRRGWAAEICRLLGELDPLEREVVALSYFRRLTTDQIAHRLAMPASDVRAAVAGGLNALAGRVD